MVVVVDVVAFMGVVLVKYENDKINVASTIAMIAVKTLLSKRDSFCASHPRLTSHRPS